MPQKLDLEVTWRASGLGTFQFTSPGNVTIPFGRTYVTVGGKGADGSSPYTTPATTPNATSPGVGPGTVPNTTTPNATSPGQVPFATPTAGVAGTPTSVLGIPFPGGAISQAAPTVPATEITYANFPYSPGGTAYPVSVQAAVPAGLGGGGASVSVVIK